MRPVTHFILLAGPTSTSRAIISELEAEVAEYTAELPAPIEAEVEAPPEAEVPTPVEAETCA